MTDEFILTTPTRSGRRGKPVKQTKVFVTFEGIAAVKAGRMTGEHLIAEAVRTALPDVRNIAVDVGSIRWTDRKTGRRVAFKTSDRVRYAMAALIHGHPLEPFRFIIGPAEPAGPDTEQPPPNKRR